MCVSRFLFVIGFCEHVLRAGGREMGASSRDVEMLQADDVCDQMFSCICVQTVHY